MINAFEVDTNQNIILVNVNGQTVHVSESDKTLSFALKIQEKLENCKSDNGLGSELYDFAADLSKQLRQMKTKQMIEN
ncbi:hypothetical protein VB796_21645 [Arcicella sp. LKC2W]|uniref:hypothetical protein n=1 Tax=Arcicella sp. LKC2W TaxID=2984198 RepID=UPI002B20FB4F|nr:hypothetical protein [Arcicella sp. LKC2W]MEA5461687.1 hypothetical protein [Arcicella sp. LKC2W]